MEKKKQGNEKRVEEFRFLEKEIGQKVNCFFCYLCDIFFAMNDSSKMKKYNFILILNVFVFFLVFILYTKKAEAEKNSYEHTSCEGITKSLNVHLSQTPTHDGSYGKTHFQLKALPGQPPNQKELIPFAKEGDWICLGYNQEAKKFILLGKFEHGVLICGQAIAYIEEQTGKWTLSQYNQKESKLDSLINQASLSADGHFLTLLGMNPNNVVLSPSQDTIHVLDTTKDTWKKLSGSIPLISPCSMIHEDGEFDDSCYGYKELDDGIITYVDNSILQVSTSRYDSLKKRDPRRVVRVYDLKKILNPKTNEVNPK